MSYLFLYVILIIMFMNLRNNLDFFLRQNIHFSRKNYNEENEDKSGLIFTEKELKREKNIIEKYNLLDYKNSSTLSNYCQNLYIIDLLDKYLSVKYKNILRVLDIGSKNWYYVNSEYSYFKKYCKNLYLDGVEIDAYRLYANFYNHLEVAKYYMKGLSGVKYIPNNLMNINDKYDYIIWILPFVLIEPHRYWGLPDKYFVPKKLFEHAYSLLNEGGKMFIINQGEQEFEAQKLIMKNKKYLSSKIETLFYKYKYDRYLSIVEKE